MVEIRPYQESDFEEVVNMYREILLEVYPNHTVKPLQYMAKLVLAWIDFNYDIMVTHNYGEITGFSLGIVDSMGGVVEDYYLCEIIYVKPEHRKGRSAYLHYHTMIEYAKSQNWILGGNASTSTSSSDIAKKIGEVTYYHYERLPNDT